MSTSRYLPQRGLRRIPEVAYPAVLLEALSRRPWPTGLLRVSLLALQAIKPQCRAARSSTSSLAPAVRLLVALQVEPRAQRQGSRKFAKGHQRK